MVKIIREYDFKAQDFFSFLQQELVKEIQKARHNKMKVKVASGLQYALKGKDGKTQTTVVIDKFEPNQVYAATFHTLDQIAKVSYSVKDLSKGCQIVLSEDIVSYHPEQHGKLTNLFYDFMYHRSAQQELNRIAEQVDKFINE